MEEQIATLTLKVEKLQQTLDWMIEHMRYAGSLSGQPIYNNDDKDDPMRNFIGGGLLKEITFPIQQ